MFLVLELEMNNSFLIFIAFFYIDIYNNHNEIVKSTLLEFFDGQ